MRQVEFFIVLGFAIMFVAGLTVGWSFSTSSASVQKSGVSPVPPQKPAGPTTGPATRPGYPFFTARLNLTEEQKQKAAAFWSEATAERERAMRAIADEDKARIADIHKLLSPELLEKYDEIQQRHEAAVANLHAEIRTAMEKVNSNFRDNILTPKQREQFDQMARERGVHHGPHRGPADHFGPPAGEHRMRPHRFGPETSASPPTTAPSR